VSETKTAGPVPALWFPCVLDRKEKLWVNDLEHPTTVDVRATLHVRGLGLVFQLHGGPTGYESFYVTEENVPEMVEKGWLACSGGDWPRLEVPADSMRQLFVGLGILQG
jgi:hypothetical protein